MTLKLFLPSSRLTFFRTIFGLPPFVFCMVQNQQNADFNPWTVNYRSKKSFSRYFQPSSYFLLGSHSGLKLPQVTYRKCIVHNFSTSVSRPNSGSFSVFSRRSNICSFIFIHLLATVICTCSVKTKIIRIIMPDKHNWANYFVLSRPPFSASNFKEQLNQQNNVSSLEWLNFQVSTCLQIEIFLPAMAEVRKILSSKSMLLVNFTPPNEENDNSITKWSTFLS